MSDGLTAAHCCEAMCDTIDAVAGVFLDATSGMERLVEDLESERAAFVATVPGHANADAAFLDSPLTYRGIAEGSEGPIHFTSRREYLRRNSLGGDNWLLLANLSLVVMYGYWEDHFRAEVAKARGTSKNDVNLDVMGELRYYRNSIVHAGGKAVEQVARNKLLPQFKRGDMIVVNAEMFVEIVFTLKRCLREFAAQLPGHAA